MLLLCARLYVESATLDLVKLSHTYRANVKRKKLPTAKISGTFIEKNNLTTWNRADSTEVSMKLEEALFPLQRHCTWWKRHPSKAALGNRQEMIATEKQRDVTRQCFPDLNQKHPTSISGETCERKERQLRLLSGKEVKKKKCLSSISSNNPQAPWTSEDTVNATSDIDFIQHQCLQLQSATRRNLAPH